MRIDNNMTAVEWLEERWTTQGTLHSSDLSQAKEMEKEQMTLLVESLKDYTKEAQCVLGNDDREPSEFVDIFLSEISDEEALSLVKEMNKQPMIFTTTEISDRVLFEQATVAMEEHYGYGCEEEIDAYFRGAKWMQSQFKNK